MTSKVVIEVRKNPGESNTSLLRRFSRRVQESGIIHKVKRGRYSERAKGALAQKVSALRRLTRAKEITRLKKLGKIA